MRTKNQVEELLSVEAIKFLKLIDDQELRAKVRDGMTIAGGCILSLFHEEEVRDYDIFLNSKQLQLEVASYFAKQVIGQIDVVGDSLESFVKKNSSLKEMNLFLKTSHSNGVKLAIESATSEAKDFKIKESSVLYDETMKTIAQRVFFSRYAITFGKYQIVLRKIIASYDDIEKTFDIKTCMAGYTFDKGLEVSVKSMSLIINKFVELNNDIEPEFNTLLRCIKYASKGYDVSPEDVLLFLYRFKNVNLNDLIELHKQLSCMYGSGELTGATARVNQMIGNDVFTYDDLKTLILS